MTMESAVMARGGATAGPGLRWLLGLDAATCLAMGVLLIAATTPLATLLALPPTLLSGAGIVLLASAAGIACAAALPRPPLVWLVIVGNAAWVLASVGVLLALEPNAAGTAFVLVQAAAVAGLLVLERRAVAAAR